MLIKLKTFVIKLLPYVVGILIGIFLWALTEIFISAMKDADVKIIAAVIAAFGSLTTGIIIAIISHSRTKSRELTVQEKISERELFVQKQITQREIEESHRQKKEVTTQAKNYGRS